MKTLHDFRPLTIALLALLSLPLSLPAAETTGRHAITHEDVWLMKRVGAPQPSPDGQWAVFSVIEPAYKEDDQVSDLWIVPADGSAMPRRLTATKTSESGLTWSPDSRRIAFSAKRDGDEEAQIYILNIAGGGEAIRVTSLSTGARSAHFSPDGMNLLFTSTVYPGTLTDEDNKRLATEHKDRKYQVRAFDGFPIRNWDKWLDEREAHLFVQPLEESTGAAAAARDLFAGTQFVQQPGFGGRRSDGGDELDAIWTPDGQSVVFAATTNRNAAAYAFTNTDLFRIDARGGSEPELITTGNGHNPVRDSWSQPRFTPDGRSLLAQYERGSGKIYDAAQVVSLPWPALQPMNNLTVALDRAVTSFAVTPNGRDVLFLAEDAGREKLYAVPVDGGTPVLAVDPNRGVYTELASAESAAAPLLVARWESAVNPAEIVRIDPATKTHQALTHFNDAAAAQIDWQPMQEFWFTSQRGRRIHNFIALPPGFDPARKYPLFVLIHGGPHGMWRDQFFVRWNYHLLAQPGYVVLLTNYTGSTGFGEELAQAIQGDPLKTPANEINQAADEAIKRFSFIDASRQAAGGASYGGHLANWLQATTTRYRCLISHAGLVNLESQWGTSDTIYGREVNNGGPVWEQGPIWRQQNPIRRAGQFRTPILVTVGENDFRVPMNNSIENWSVLQRREIPSRLLVFPEENHWILKGENSRYFYGEVQAWLKRWLDSPAAQ